MSSNSSSDEFDDVEASNRAGAAAGASEVERGTGAHAGAHLPQVLGQLDSSKCTEANAPKQMHSLYN